MSNLAESDYYNITDQLPADVPEQKTWMSEIKDRVPFTMLSIPGTHCSCSAFISSPKWRHQSLDISHSLRAGVRYFDVQMTLQENKLVLWQDNFSIGKDIDPLIESLVYFLTINKSEVIIVCLTEAYEPEGGFNFSDVVYQKIHKDVPSENIWMYNQLPETLGEARGKIIFLRNYSDGEARFVPFQNCVSSNRTGETADYEAFWDKREKFLTQVNNKRGKIPALHITYLSHKDLYCKAAYTINKSLFDFLSKNQTNNHWGVIAMDFPGSLLIKKIIQNNRFCNTSETTGRKGNKAIEWSGVCANP